MGEDDNRSARVQSHSRDDSSFLGDCTSWPSALAMAQVRTHTVSWELMVDDCYQTNEKSNWAIRKNLFLTVERKFFNDNIQ
jgi:hypothetical protein